MVEYGQYPLVLQLQNGLPVGLAESTGNFSSINLIVSSVSANEYLGLTGSVTIPLPIIQGGTGATGVTDAQINLELQPGVDVQTHSVRLDDISLAAPTANYFIVGDGANWKSISPGNARTSLSLVPGTDVQVQNANLQALAGATLAQNRILVGGAAGTITTISTPTDGNYLKYNTVGGFSWAAGGSVNLPDVQYAVLYDNGSDTFASDQNVKIQNGVFSASNASAVNSSANTFYENGVNISTKYWLESNGNLQNLKDVNLGTLSNGDVLKYNGNKWVNGTDNTGAGGSPGGDLNNVQINYAGNFSGNDGLKYNLNTSTLTGSTFSATVVSAGTLHIGGSDGYIVNNNGAIWISATDTIKVIPGLSATSWFGLPSGLDASSLKGYPVVSSYQGPNPEPQTGETLLFISDSWYYGTPAAAPGGSNTQIQYNSGGAIAGSPAMTWDNSTSTLISKNISATEYLNLPSSIATWNANKLQGVTVTSTAPVATQHLEYDGTSWKPEWNSVSTINSTVTLTNTCDEKLFVSSSGSKVTVTLPDPTTCAGKEIQLIKSDPSGMPVYVSAATLQAPGNLIAMRIPRDMVQVISDGTNWYIQHNNSSYGGSHEVGTYDVEFEDFIWGSTETGEVGIRNWSFTNGTVAVVNNTGADGTGRGVINRQSGTTANQVASFYPMAAGTNTPNYANEILDFKIRQYPTTITLYKIRFGMFSDMTADPPASGIYFECSSGQSNYQAITRNGAVETKTDTGVAVDAAAFSTFRIFRRSDSAIEFYINDNAVATNTANIPSQHAVTFGYQCIPTTTTAKGSNIDYISVAIVDTTQRY